MSLEPTPPTPLQEPSAPRAAGGCWKGCLLMVGGALLLVLLLLSPGIFAVATGVTTFNAFLEGIRDFLDPRPSAQIIPGETIIARIQPMGDLVSVRVQLAKANILARVRYGVADACSFEARHVAQAVIEASVDLSAVSPANLTLDAAGQITRITLPPARLFRCALEQFDQYTHSQPPGCVVPLDDAENLARYTALNEFREDTLAGGIRRQAEREASFLVGNLVELLTGRRVEIVFDAGDSPPPDDRTCFPQPPPGWSFDAATQSWRKS